MLELGIRLLVKYAKGQSKLDDVVVRRIDEQTLESCYSSRKFTQIVAEDFVMRYVVSLLLVSVCNQLGFAAEFGMKQGNPEFQSVGSLAFGPDGVLFVGDTKAATVYALDTQDHHGSPSEVTLELSGVDQKAAKALGVDKVEVRDFAINPHSGTGYLSVSSGDGSVHAICRVWPNGKLEKLSLDGIYFSKVELPNPPADKPVGRRNRNYRDYSITDLAFMEGKVLVSGAAGGQGDSTVREIVFPFYEADKGVNVEIFHGAHGRFETNATVRTFVPFKINNEPYLLAGFQCTPLVKFPIEALQGDDKVRGTTLAELGNRNTPLDMFVYQKDGRDFLLLSNDRRGVMKISTDDVEREKGITEKIQGLAGQQYDTIESFKDVVQMDKLNDRHAVLLTKNDSGWLDMKTVELP